MYAHESFYLLYDASWEKFRKYRYAKELPHHSCSKHIELKYIANQFAFGHLNEMEFVELIYYMKICTFWRKQDENQ